MALGINIGGWGGGGTAAAWPGVTGTNANPSPQGPTTSAAAGFGVSAGDSGLDAQTTATLSVGTLALIGLIYIWWSLPR